MGKHTINTKMEKRGFVKLKNSEEATFWKLSQAFLMDIRTTKGDSIQKTEEDRHALVKWSPALVGRGSGNLPPSEGEPFVCDFYGFFPSVAFAEVQPFKSGCSLESALSLIPSLGGLHVGEALPTVIHVSGPDMRLESFICVCVFPRLLQVGPVISEAQRSSGDRLRLLFLKYREQNHPWEFSAPGHLQFHPGQICSWKIVLSETRWSLRSRSRTYQVV